MFHFGSTCSEKIIYKKIFHSCHGPSRCWTSFNGIQHFLTCDNPSGRARDSIEMLFVIVPLCRVFSVPGSLTRVGWAQHITASVSSRGNHATTTQCLVQNVPPASRSIIHAVCRFLQSCCNIRWTACFWWQLTHSITVHTIRLWFTESCLKIYGKGVPNLVGCHLATHPKSGSCGSKGIRLLIFFLLVLKTSQYPSCFCLGEVTLFLSFDGEHPSSGHMSSRFDLPQVNKIKNLVVDMGLVL